MRNSELQTSVNDTDLAVPGEYKSASRVALLGQDFRGVNLELLCQQGDKVKAGAALMRDAQRPRIVFTSPVSGEVAKIEFGARRKLASLQIDVDENLDSIRFSPAESDSSAGMREFMLDSGAWNTLRTRPFGNIPDPEGEPAAIFVTAIDNDLQAPAAGPIIDLFAVEFRAAVNALANVSASPVYVCHASGYRPPVDTSEQLHCQPFPDDYRMGLPGAHINALCPIGFAGKEIWHIGYQEVISLGHLLLNGTPWPQRIITLSGNALKRPRYLRVLPGASIHELLADELDDDTAVTILSGSAEYGRQVAPRLAFLSAGQRQLTALSGSSAESPGSIDQPVIPTESLDAFAPPGIYAVPLMRALQVGDIDRARELGALELVEEDLAALSRACRSQFDYGLSLRQILDQLQGEYR